MKTFFNQTENDDHIGMIFLILSYSPITSKFFAGYSWGEIK